MALPKKAAPSIPPVAFNEDAFYTGGFQLPEGTFWWKSVEFVEHTGFGEKKFAARLGVMIEMIPLEGADKKSYHQFYGLGGKAIESFCPHPDNPHWLAQRAEPKSSTLNDSTNWALLRESMKNAGVPAEVFAANDLATFEGMWAYMKNVPEPESRKQIRNKAQTGEASMGPQDEIKSSGTVAIVSEVLENGKPWEGTGGEPAEEVAAPAPKATKAAAPVKAASKPNGKVAPAPPADEEAEEDLKSIALAALTSVLEKNEAGLSMLKLRTEAFKTVSPEWKQQLQSEFFTDAAMVSSVLGDLGFAVKGNMVAPA